jgi:hypothetical protein
VSCPRQGPYDVGNLGLREGREVLDLVREDRAVGGGAQHPRGIFVKIPLAASHLFDQNTWSNRWLLKRTVPLHGGRTELMA